MNSKLKQTKIYIILDIRYNIKYIIYNIWYLRKGIFFIIILK